MNAYAWNIGFKVSFLIFFSSTDDGVFRSQVLVCIIRSLVFFLLEYSRVRHLRYGDICSFNFVF